MASCDIRSSYKGKTLFMTGATGFIGKVHLYKLLKSFPDMERIYVLVRTKKQQAPQERLVKDIFASPCFDPLKQQLGETEWARRMALVTALSGDVMEERLGLSAEDYATVLDRVNIIVHWAATVDFQEKLNISVKMNVLGTLRVLTMAKKCRQLECFCHVSTCYTNWNRHGRDVPVAETVYPLSFDPEGMCKYILSLHDSQVPAESARLLKLHRFPNTYTFTKCMTEHLLQEQKEAVPLVIVRPSIVGCAWREPMPGWVDALTSAGAIFLTSGLGVLRELHCNPHYVADIVPVDFVANAVIKVTHKCVSHFRSIASQAAVATTKVPPPATTVTAAAAVVAAKAAPVVIQPSSVSRNPAAVSDRSSKVPESIASDIASAWSLPLIFHAGTSGSLNQCTWGICRDSVKTYFRAQPHAKQFTTPVIELHKTNAMYLFKWYVVRKLPFEMLTIMNELPLLQSSERGKQLQKYSKVLDRADFLNMQFYPFMNFEWVFSLDHQRIMDDGFDQKTRDEFCTDCYDINWVAYIHVYCFGLIKYVMKALDKGRNLPPIPPSGSELFLRASL